MEEAVGLSHLYPTLPLMQFISVIMCLMLLPGFWKTRIVALVALVSWLALGNLLYLIGMIHWRGNVDDAPIFAILLALMGRLQFTGVFASMACFAHFTWQRLHPLRFQKLYDTRRKNNWIHIFFTLILPLLWTPLGFFSCTSRYILVEDLGPVMRPRKDWVGYTFHHLPQLLGCVVVGILDVLTLVNYWRIKRDGISPKLLNQHASVRTRKLLLMALVNAPLALWGVYNQVVVLAETLWRAETSFAENIASLQVVLQLERFHLDGEWLSIAHTGKIRLIFGPLLVVDVFAWFGFGEEARKGYVEAATKVVNLFSTVLKELLSHVGAMPFPWPPSIALSILRLPKGVTNSLLLGHLDPPHITPYISTVPTNDGPSQPVSPTQIRPSNPFGNVLETKWQIIIPPPAPIHRASCHKPPIVPAAVIVDAQGSMQSRVENTTNTKGREVFVPPPRARRLSYHKPPLVPLMHVPAPDAMGTAMPLVDISIPSLGNVPLDSVNTAAVTPITQGILPSRVEHVDITKRQARILPLARPRRLSYHKPPFVPLMPVPAPDDPATATPSVDVPIPLSRSAPLNPANAAAGIPNPRVIIPSRGGNVANTENQEILMPLAPARRLSYHKPPLVALAPVASVPVPVPDNLGTATPLVDVLTPSSRSRNTEPIRENVMDGMASAAVSTPASPTFTAPPSFWTGPPRTPAPPYQDLTPLD